jgi:putative FmdB family regulatory protein
MPIYEYRCEQGHTFEVIQRMTDDPVASCQTCAAPVQRVFHPVAVHFKGSGFYNTDYGTRKRAREKGDGAEGAKTAEKGADTKDTAAKSDSKSSSGSDSATAKPKAAASD